MTQYCEPPLQPDHLSVFIPEIRTLFPGDAAEDPLPFVRDAAALPDMRASFERLLSLDPVTVLYCHVLGSHSPDVIYENIAYFEDIERRTAAALASGQISAQFAAVNDVEALIGYPFAEVPHIEHDEVQPVAL